MNKIIVVDDEPKICRIIKLLLTDAGYEVEIANSGEEALVKAASFNPDVALLDLKMPGIDGIETMCRMQKLFQGVQYIIITANGEVPDAVKAINAGAYNFIKKPFDNEELIGIVKGALEVKKMYDIVVNLQSKLHQSSSLANFIGENSAIIELKKLISKIAPTDAAVLVCGESGTGKELVVKSLHELSQRKHKPLITVNCSAISEGLFESEFFGHVRGAFTGAIKANNGRFLEADGGTLFLDELGELPLTFQAKLLRALESGEIVPVGSSKTINVDVRIIAATNSDIEQMIEQKLFREDLYYRLKTFILEISPLRERKGDITLIAKIFAEKHNRTLSKESLNLLTNYPWKGNVRELKNEIERAAILSNNIIEPACFSFANKNEVSEDVNINSSTIDLEEVLENIKKDYFIKAMQIAGGNKFKAAQILNLSYRKFDYQWRKFRG
ncbi:MAG: sigma-54 dependent transcriptional regulator [Candidatus Cloacimonadales bacterium]